MVLHGAGVFAFMRLRVAATIACGLTWCRSCWPLRENEQVSAMQAKVDEARAAQEAAERDAAAARRAAARAQVG